MRGITIYLRPDGTDRPTKEVNEIRTYLRGTGLDWMMVLARPNMAEDFFRLGREQKLVWQAAAVDASVKMILGKDGE